LIVLLNPPFLTQAQKRLTDQIAEHQASNHNYFQDGGRLLELSKKAYFLFEKRIRPKTADCSISCVRTQPGRTLTATFRQPFDLLAITNTTWQREEAAGADSSGLRPLWLPTVDPLRNFFLTPTTEMLSFFQEFREAF
jgi:hypothetical protein